MPKSALSLDPLIHTGDNNPPAKIQKWLILSVARFWHPKTVLPDHIFSICGLRRALGRLFVLSRKEEQGSNGSYVHVLMC
mmetsp:Transcript_17028/g.27063  ORF Transcript_17028/g.27063 Transcript_17028/m.27063 type:complete len:80 (+) Transcript_17028:248-487(+)